MTSLKDRVAIVTGGARGIGAAVTKKLAELGACVVAADNDINHTSPSSWGTAPLNTERCLLLLADVADRYECHRLQQETIEAFGRLDILVNCAGGPLGIYKTFESMDEADYQRVLDVNLKASFFMSQAATPQLKRTGNGRIVNFASELGILGSATMIAYATSKGGVIALTRSLARALAPSITVNAIAPGPVLTQRLMDEDWFRDEVSRSREIDKVPLGAFSTPEQVANTVAFLVGAGGSQYTGQTFNINGGLVMV